MAKYNCSNCREVRDTETLKKVSIGKDRFVLFCGDCNCYVAIQEPVAVKKVEAKVETKPAE